MELIKSFLQSQNTAFESVETIQEIRSAIQNKKLSYIKIQKAVYPVIGENPDKLIIKKDGKLYEITDNMIRKTWTGEAIILLDSLDIKCEIDDFVIFAASRDTWESNKLDKKINSKNKIALIKNLRYCELPDHPVIVIFLEPSESEFKDGIRSSSVGAEIRIYDESDIFSEFAHELGHIFFNNRLNKVEKSEFNKLAENLDKDSLPAIFVSKWSYKTGEEIFATVYMWYVQGEILHQGYLKILEKEYPEGYLTLVNIFERIQNETEIEEIKNKEIEEINRNWQNNEKRLAAWVSQFSSNSINIQKGKSLIKAHFSNINIPKTLKIPDDLKKTVLVERNGRKWINGFEGNLKEQVLVVKSGSIDFEFMKTRGVNIPIETVKKFSNGKQIKRVNYVKPETFFKSKEKKIIKMPQKIEIIEKKKGFLNKLKEFIKGQR